MYEQDWLNAEQEQTCYRTGFTEPKKTNRGLLAAVLMLAIFLCGLNTAFRLLNIRLFREITRDAGIAPASVQFSANKDSTPAQPPHVPALGISGENISDFEHLYYNVPVGFYITEVVAGSPANHAGILPGDVLLSLNGHQIPDLAVLEQKIAAYRPGETVRLLLHRQNSEITIDIQLEK